MKKLIDKLADLAVINDARIPSVAMPSARTVEVRKACHAAYIKSVLAVACHQAAAVSYLRRCEKRLY